MNPSRWTRALRAKLTRYQASWPATLAPLRTGRPRSRTLGGSPDTLQGAIRASETGAAETAPIDQEALKRKLTWRPEAPPTRFLNVFMDQNNRCNLRCKMCGFSDARVGALRKYDLPRWLFDRIAAQLFPHTRFLCLSLMTEPFMTRDFPDRLELVRTHGVPYSEIITNGTLLNDRSIGRILDAAINRLTFSIDGGTKETFETIRVGARFDDVVGNFGLVHSMRGDRGTRLPRLRINHVLSEYNIDVFDAFLSLVESLRADEIGVRTVSRMSEAIIQESTDPAFWAKVNVARERLRRFCERTGIEDSGYLRDRPTRIQLFNEVGEKMACRCPWDTVAIHANGDVYPCMAWSRPPIGNFVRQTFNEIWNGNELKALQWEFEDLKPGVDCLHCTIRRDAATDRDDDFFYRKLAKSPGWLPRNPAEEGRLEQPQSAETP